MPTNAKLTLSDHELAIASNADWILTKHSVIDTVYNLFGLQVPVIQKVFLGPHDFPEEIRQSSPKISRGEQYLKLPYVVLDYPRMFQKQDIFALRTFFWWAGFVSITIQVSGKYKGLLKNFMCADVQTKADLYCCVSDDPWAHHFGPDNYQPFSELTKSERRSIYEGRDFVKLAIKYPLSEWNQMGFHLADGYARIACLFA
ncbi:MAG TPA: hypothetical protein DCQ34_09615 [Chitinophagaceae bacterium]|nr:hypothetical protein [Chitinophagaceae bacterium]HCY89251.1 hypothetical protein [Chitinophagaceae bacterium]HRF26417.1 hypothetical protein [Ferruginibacter sp.]